MTFSRDLIEIMSVDQLAALNARQLKDISDVIAEQKETIKAVEQRLQVACERRYGQAVTVALRDKRADTGTVHINDPESNETSVLVNIPKKVDWNQEALMNALGSMSVEDARHYGKVEVTVEEKKFTASPDSIRLKLSMARTVKPGKPKFTFQSEVE
jgi:hypothetical protein